MIRTRTASTKIVSHLRSVCEANAIPGASIALLRDGVMTTAGVGFANRPANIEVDERTIFQIGSVTKPFTASAIMTLVDEGALSLDTTLAEALPELVMESSSAPQQITISQLLDHSSGIDGDLLTDTGPGDDALAKLVEVCRGIKLLHAPGKLFSYSNVAYNLLGRIIEKQTGKTWDAALRERVLSPLSLTSAVTLPESYVRFRMALGHERREGTEDFALVPFWPRSNSASGTRLAMTSADLLQFAMAHMDDSEQAFLSLRSRQLMRNVSSVPPFSDRFRGWGLGWALPIDYGDNAFGHDGAAAGMVAYLRVWPSDRLAITVMANGGNASALFIEMMNQLMPECMRRASKRRPSPPEHLNLAPYVGRYERNGWSIIIDERDGHLHARGEGHYLPPDDTSHQLIMNSRERFTRDPVPPVPELALYFAGFDPKGRPDRIHFQERVFPRVAPKA